MAQIICHKVRHDFPVLDNGDPVTGSVHFGENMAGKKDRFAPLFLVFQVVDKDFLHHRVKSAGRFVEDQNVGIVHKRRHNSEFSLDAKTHSLGIAGRIQFEQGKQLIQLFLVSAPLHILHHAQKLPAGKACRQRYLSGDIADRFQYFVILVKRLFSEYPRLAAVWLGKAHQVPDRSGFSRSVRSQKTEHLSFLHLKGHVKHAASEAVVLC